MKQKKSGHTDRDLSAIRLECMSIKYAYRDEEDQESILIMDKALELVINFWVITDIEDDGNLTREFDDFAKSKNCSPAQLAVAWLLGQNENIIPAPGTKHEKYVEKNATSADIELSAEDFIYIESLLQHYI